MKILALSHCPSASFPSRQKRGEKCRHEEIEVKGFGYIRELNFSFAFAESGRKKNKEKTSWSSKSVLCAFWQVCMEQLFAKVSTNSVRKERKDTELHRMVAWNYSATFANAFSETPVNNSYQCWKASLENSWRVCLNWYVYKRTACWLRVFCISHWRQWSMFELNHKFQMLIFTIE